MSRLSGEIQRLFATAAPGCTRALVLGLCAPADTGHLTSLASFASHHLGWPSPALAIDGRGSLQLWWALASPLPLVEAAGLAAALARRGLPDAPQAAIEGWPKADGAAAPLPGGPTSPGRWSAFIAPDLAPVFSAEPWLDVPPNDAGQADLLAGLQAIPDSDVARAQQMLLPAPAVAATPAPPAASPPAGHLLDPRQFLTRVMNDASAPLALRIEAAQALLAHSASQAR